MSIKLNSFLVSTFCELGPPYLYKKIKKLS